MGENTKKEFKFLDKTMKKMLENLGRSIGNAMVGNQAQSARSGTDMMGMIPKMLASMIAGTRATGGSVAGNNPYLVGERGPEIFVPNSSGSIIPNANMSRSPINMVMNISTPNADSFKKSQNQILSEAITLMSRAGRNL